MEWQTVITLVLGFLALVYAGWYFLRQFFQVKKKPECEDCPVPNQEGKRVKLEKQKYRNIFCSTVQQSFRHG